MSDKISLYTDEPEKNKILLEFPKYISTIYNLIINSKPQYTLGIFGEWGSGKSTLMKNIMSTLEATGCKCVEFNAWRFAYEERHATFPLMLTILSKILDDKNVQQSLKTGKLQTIKNKLWQVIKGLKGSITLKIPETAELNLEIDPSLMTDENIDDIDKFSEKSKPILQQGIEIISALIKELKSPDANPELKLVVFIDDLDRCTPEKATEIFESVKVFFDLEGIVFVFGLSQSIIEAAINYKYEHFKEKFSGKDYLKKIIQVPFVLPSWSKSDLQNFAQALIENNDTSYSDFFKQNVSLLSFGVENPREVKRILNNFILSHQIQRTNQSIDMKKLLAVQILSLRWKEFYDAISLDPKLAHKFTKTRKSLGKITDAMLEATVGVTNQGVDMESRKDPLVKKFENDENLMQFLTGEGKIISEISENEWEIYRRSVITEPDLDNFEKLRTKIKEEPKTISIQILTTGEVNLIDELPFWIKGGSQIKGKKPSSLAKSLEVDVNENESLIFQYVVPIDLNVNGAIASHSSDIKLEVKIDGEKIHETEWLGYKNRSPQLPMETNIVGIFGITSGKHFLTLQPETKESYLDNWGGILRTYSIKGISRPIQNEDGLREPSKPVQNADWLKENVYVPIYNKIVKTSNDPNKFSTIPNDPWKELEPIAKLRMENDVKEVLQKYSDALDNWKITISNLNSKYITNQNQLGNIVKTAFEKANLIKPDGFIQLDERSSQEPLHWLETFKFIMFDDSITTPEILYEKLLTHTKITANGHQQFIQKWNMEKPLLFTYIFNILPQLRTELRIDSTQKEMTQQKMNLQELERKIIILLEEKIR